MRWLIDGHLDLAWNALSWGRDVTLNLDRLNRDEVGMTDHPSRGRATTTLPEMRRAGIAVCQATLLARAKPEIRQPEGHARISLDFANQDALPIGVEIVTGPDHPQKASPLQFRSRHPLGALHDWQSKRTDWVSRS